MHTPANNLPKFLDPCGREWTLILDFAAMRRIRESASIDLGDVERLGESWALLLYDDDKALAVLWLAIVSQADALGVEREAFLGAMDGASLQSATEALAAAIVNFTRPQKRGMATRAIDGLTSGYQAAIKSAEARIQTAVDTTMQEALQALGTPAPAVPGSSATSTSDGP